MKYNVKATKVNKIIVAKVDPKNEKTGVESKVDLPNTTVEYLVKKSFESADFFKQLREYLSKQTETNVIDLDSFIALDKVNAEKMVQWVVNAVEFAEAIPFSKKTKKQPKPEFILQVDKKFEKTIKEASVVAKATTLVRELQDTPSDVLYPQTFVERFLKEFKGIKNVKISVLDKKQIKAKKMGMILGVNKGSIHECKLLVVEYLNNPSSKQKFAYVGKGICYDSGGMNLKPGPHMRTMKYDMSGAAIVTGTVLALAKNNVKTNVISVAPLTENLLSNQAQRPDDIVIAYNGKSVEIDNTDAEGRLVLGDAITYAAKDLKATRIFDVATLTGAMIYALGHTYTGVWATNDAHWNEIDVAGKNAAEALWRLPLHNDYLKMLDSPIADIMNSVSRPEAGSSRAAMFLTQFREGVDLVHIDIAGTANSSSGTGEGVVLRTLYEQAKLLK
ncbi:leucyl aminopeptidase [[Mycoplasma] testudinis]|uniref:leucyl aminopeptidase n=1 Tax=[Mycoplasma] testudinis TaxID=33924 RepID=UPI000480FC5B|nr:leucyl aminopeptidase [[Mycoplasma] testudinis]